MSYDSFKPKFPLDPFTDAGVPTPREPWSVDTDNLPSLPLLQAERKVILIIGRESLSSCFYVCRGEVRKGMWVQK